MALMSKLMALHFLLVGCGAMQARPQRRAQPHHAEDVLSLAEQHNHRAQPRSRRRTEDPDVLTEASVEAQRRAAERAAEALAASQRAYGTTPATEELEASSSAATSEIPAEEGAKAPEESSDEGEREEDTSFSLSDESSDMDDEEEDEDEVKSTSPDPIPLPWRIQESSPDKAKFETPWLSKEVEGQEAVMEDREPNTAAAEIAAGTQPLAPWMKQASANPTATPLSADGRISGSAAEAETDTEASESFTKRLDEATTKSAATSYAHTDVGGGMGEVESQASEVAPEPSDATPAASSKVLPAPWMSQHKTDTAAPTATPSAAVPSPYAAADSGSEADSPSSEEYKDELKTAQRLRAELDEAEAASETASATQPASPDAGSSSSVGEAEAEANEEYEEQLKIAQRLRAELAGNQGANEAASVYREAGSPSSASEAEEAAPQSEPSHDGTELTEEDYQQAVQKHTMVDFIRRVIEAGGGEIKQEDKSEKMLEMLAKWHGGERATQTLKDLRAQLRKAEWISGFA